MGLIDRYPAEFDRMPHYGAEGCVCGNVATPDRSCPLHAANWIIERLEDQLRRAVQVSEVVAALRARAETFSSRRTRGAFLHAAEVVDDLFGGQ